MRKLNKNNGITLISLVITIIVMLILVGVSINLAVNGGLFEYAGNAVGDTKNAMKQEQDLIDDIIENHIKTNTGEVIIGNDGEKFSAIYEQTTKITQTEGDKTYTAWIPKGFSVGTYPEEISKISTGLVIRDAEGNEFVWIPVEGEVEGKKLVNPYTAKSDYSEPTTLSTDESNISTYFENMNLFSYSEDFNYASEYATMEDRIKFYNGFYIGRYETTIDESGNIGSKYNTKVLTAGDQFTYKGTSYYYRWYGLYYFQKNANVTENGEAVQTAMIYGQLWDKAMEFIRTNDTNYNVDSATSGWHTGNNVVKSGQANSGDVALNIWDLESNAYEWTQEASSTNYRVLRGGGFGRNGGVYKPASSRYSFFPKDDSTSDSSRLALYINK